MTLKKQIKVIHEEHYPYTWTFKHHGEIIPATVYIKPGIILDIVGCISDDGYDLMDGFISKLTKKDILDHFRLKHGRRSMLTEQLINSLNNN